MRQQHASVRDRARVGCDMAPKGGAAARGFVHVDTLKLSTATSCTDRQAAEPHAHQHAQRGRGLRVVVQPAGRRGRHHSWRVWLSGAGMLGFVPLPGMVGYGATVWNPPPTHPPELRNMVPRGGPTHPPRITEHEAGNQRNYSGNQVK